jgi:hypothetical protein
MTPTPQAPAELLAYDFAALAREIAMDIFELKDILYVHKLTDTEWQKIQANPKFQEMVASMTAEWNSAANTKERIRIKSSTGLEAVLETYINDIRDTTIPLGQRVEAGKFLAKIGEIDTANIIGGAAGGSGFSVTLNIGTSQVQVRNAHPRVIEHDDVEDVEDVE